MDFDLDRYDDDDDDDVRNVANFFGGVGEGGGSLKKILIQTLVGSCDCSPVDIETWQLTSPITEHERKRRCCHGNRRVVAHLRVHFYAQGSRILTLCVNEGEEDSRETFAPTTTTLPYLEMSQMRTLTWGKGRVLTSRNNVQISHFSKSLLI